MAVFGLLVFHHYASSSGHWMMGRVARALIPGRTAKARRNRLITAEDNAQSENTAIQFSCGRHLCMCTGGFSTGQYGHVALQWARFVASWKGPLALIMTMTVTAMT
eukprot:3388038-Amphidinium_carterae.2